MRIMVSMPEKFLGEIDSVADKEHRSRSELIREALRIYMGKIKSPLADKNANILEELLN